jgi:hypothetical protein
MRTLLLSFLYLFLSIDFTAAQVDTIYSISSKSIAESLRETTDQYLVFIQFNNKPKQTMTSLWSRSIHFKKHNNQDVIEVEQKWYASDSSSYRYVYSLVDKRTFSPIYHKVWSQRGTEAFDFYPDKIVGSDTVANNSKKGFMISIKKPTLNWELDLETFGLLPLASNRSFMINFYHPGGKTAPAFYKYTVIGDDILTLGKDTKVPCWKLKIDYSEKSWAIFYINKKTKEIIKMEESFGMGVRYKVKLPLAIATQ